MAEFSMLSTCKGSDLEHDLCCYVCDENGIQTEALYFCENCSRCYCENCNRQHGQMFKRHKSIGQEEKWRWQIEIKEESLEPIFHCQEHRNEAIKLLCQDHDQLLCEKCDLSNHRKCQVNRIAGRMKKQCHIPDFEQLLNIIESKLGQLDRFKEDRREDIQELQATCDNQFADIESFRQQIDESLNRLEAKAKVELVDVRVKLKTELEADVDRCCLVKRKLQLLHNALTKFGECPEHSYIAIRMIQKITRDTDFFKETKTAKRTKKPKFVPQTIIEQYVSSMSVLGNILCEETTPRCKLCVTGESFYNIRYKDEQSTCNINGICETHFGEFIIIDSRNQSVKLLDKFFDVIAHLSLSEIPRSICLVDSSEVAISLYCSKIDFIAVNGKLVKKRSLYLDHSCTSIAFSNSSLFVTADKELYMYAIDGRRIKKIHKEKSGKVSGCAVSTDGEKIYVVRKPGFLLSLSRTGDVLAKLRVPEVGWDTNLHVHVAQTGQILLSYTDSQSIIQVDSECTKILATICMKQFSDQQPQSIYYSRVKSAIVVGMDFDKILVLKTKTLLC